MTLDFAKAWRGHLGPILGSTVSILASSWTLRLHLEGNLASKLPSSSPQDHNKTSEQHLGRLSEGFSP